MKIRLFTLFITAVLMVSLLTACTPSAPTNDTGAGNTTTTVADVTTTVGDPLTGDTTTAPNGSVANVPEGSLSAEQAQEIALKDAGLTAADVTGLHVEVDRDDGVVYYDVQFYQGTTEYDYDIHAQTGAILEKDRDID